MWARAKYRSSAARKKKKHSNRLQEKKFCPHTQLLCSVDRSAKDWCFSTFASVPRAARRNGCLISLLQLASKPFRAALRVLVEKLPSVDVDVVRCLRSCDLVRLNKCPEAIDGKLSGAA